MSAMEQDQPTPNDPLYYAPRRLRERPEPPPNPEMPPPPTSVYQLPRSLDPEVMQEVTGALSVIGVNSIETGTQHGRGRDYILSDGCELTKDVLDLEAFQAGGLGRCFCFYQHLP